MKYNLELVKKYLDESDFEALNNILYAIMNKGEHTLEDLTILEFLSDDPRINKESAQVVKEYSNKVVEELKEKQILEAEEIKEEAVEEEKKKEEVVTPLVEEPNKLEKVEPITNNSKPISEEDAKRNKYEEEYKAYLSSKFILYGLTIKELSFDKSEPHITFDNTKEAKNVIDNLMLNLYQNAKDIPNLGFDLTKLWTTGEEFFTVSLASGQPLNNNSIMDMFQNVEKIVDNTEKDKNYEELLPSNLQNMKALYSGHTPDVPNENFRIGYVNVNGEDNFYVVSSSKEKSIRLTEEMGFIPRTIGESNVVSIDTGKQNPEKIDAVSEDLSTTLKKEPPKVYTLKPNPRNVSVPNAAYSNIKNITLIIVLVIAVIIAVSVMTLRG
ncbi:unknown [Clostridium sp. CAG:710]|nr:unknown [Clostridium sp. CAG:710]